MILYIKEIKTGLVLDIKDGTEPEVIMGNYQRSPNQLWEYKSGMIYSKLNGLVLEMKRVSHTLCFSEAHGALNQLWDFETDGRIRNKGGLVLDAGEQQPKPGSHVDFFATNDKRIQVFRIVPVSNSEEPQWTSLLFH